MLKRGPGFLCLGEAFKKVIFNHIFRLGEVEVLSIIREIIEGLKYCSSMNVVHRNLKLSNILINEHFAIKLAGFFLAKL